MIRYGMLRPHRFYKGFGIRCIRAVMIHLPDICTKINSLINHPFFLLRLRITAGQIRDGLASRGHCDPGTQGHIVQIMLHPGLGQPRIGGGIVFKVRQIKIRKVESLHRSRSQPKGIARRHFHKVLTILSFF